MLTVSLRQILIWLIREFGYGAVNAEVQQIQLAIQNGKLTL